MELFRNLIQEDVPMCIKMKIFSLCDPLYILKIHYVYRREWFNDIESIQILMEVWNLYTKVDTFLQLVFEYDLIHGSKIICCWDNYKRATYLIKRNEHIIESKDFNNYNLVRDIEASEQYNDFTTDHHNCIVLDRHNNYYWFMMGKIDFSEDVECNVKIDFGRNSIDKLCRIGKNFDKLVANPQSIIAGISISDGDRAREVLKYLCLTGNVNELERHILLYSSRELLCLFNELMISAIIGGHEDMIKWLLHFDCRYPDKLDNNSLVRNNYLYFNQLLLVYTGDMYELPNFLTRILDDIILPCGFCGNKDEIFKGIDISNAEYINYNTFMWMFERYEYKYISKILELERIDIVNYVLNKLQPTREEMIDYLTLALVDYRFETALFIYTKLNLSREELIKITEQYGHDGQIAEWFVYRLGNYDATQYGLREITIQ